MAGTACWKAGAPEPRRNSPGKTHGHGALASPVSPHRCPGQPLPGDTACMLEGREQMPAGMSTSAGPGDASPRDGPRGPALSLPSWLMGRAGGLGEEGGTAGTGVPVKVPTAQPGPRLLRKGGALPRGGWGAPASPCHRSRPHADHPDTASARPREGYFALTLLHRVGGLALPCRHGARQR